MKSSRGISTGGDRWCACRCRPGPCRFATVVRGLRLHEQVEDGALSPVGVGPGLLAVRHGLRQHQEHPPARRADGVERPDLMRLSMALPLTVPRSTRSQKSKRSRKGPSCSRASRMLRMAVSPTFLTAFRPKRMRPSTPAEVEHRLVDVGRQHLDAHLVGHGHVEGHLVLGVHDAGDERRHVLHGDSWPSDRRCGRR